MIHQRFVTVKPEVTGAQQWRELLAHLWRGGSYGYFWGALPDPEKVKVTEWTKLPDPAPAHPARWEGVRNIYFGVHPVRRIPDTDARGKPAKPASVRGRREDVDAVNCLFAEFDAQDFVTVEEYTSHLPANFATLDPKKRGTALQEAKEAAALADLPTYKARILAHLEDLLHSEDAIPFPSVIVDSGGGYHCYWLLDETVTVTDEKRAHLDALQKAWVDLVGSDPRAKDLARVLRVPGTLNLKPERGPNYPQVTIIEADFRRVYDLGLFEALTEEISQEQPTPAPAVVHTPAPAGAHLDDAELLRRMFASKSGAKIQRLFDGNTEDYGGDHSAADMALCNHLAFFTGKDPARMDAMFRQSGLMRPKWDVRHSGDGDTYGQMTIAAAIAGTADVYTNGAGPGRNHGSTPSGAGFEAETPDPADLDGARFVQFAAADGFVFDLPFDKFRAEDGGILDAWRSLPESEDWIFVPEHGDWARWAGTHWERGAGAQLFARLQSLMDSINLQALGAMRAAYADMAALGKDDEDERAALSAEAAEALAMVKATKRSAARVRSVEELAQAWATVPSTKLDAGNLLNLANGTLDLDTGNVAPHRREDRLTYTLPYSFDAGADCPRWRRFLSEVLVNVQTLEPDKDLAGLAQELVGLSLTTDTRHEVMAWLSGEGGTGKSSFLHVLGRLLGPLSIRVDFQGLDRPNDYSLAKLPGRRVALSTEAQKGGGAGERWIKSIVSGEPIPAREIYGRPFEFTPVCKIWWAMNDRPVIKDTSDAIWRRLALIPFNRRFTPEERDRDLTRKLETELPGILNWALEGLARLRSRGRLPEVEAVAVAVSEYRHETNAIAQWLAERTVKNEAAVTRAAAAFNDYAAWSKDNGRQPMNNTNFARELARLGHDKGRDNRGVYYRFGLLEDRDAPPTPGDTQLTHTPAAAARDELLESLGL